MEAKRVDVNFAIETLKYYGGWAGKVNGKMIEVRDRGAVLVSGLIHRSLQSSPAKFAYTRIEPIGVVGLIVPWNFPRGLRSSRPLGPMC
jgi:acyl-CoA reductase-like NAD-dependent aldehyde dehydrogenase